MNPSQRYTKKPVTIDAAHWDGTPEGAIPIIDWILRFDGTARWHEEYIYLDVNEYVTVPTHIAINTLEGTVRADHGDYVIKGVKDEFYPIKAEIFAATYETEQT